MSKHTCSTCPFFEERSKDCHYNPPVHNAFELSYAENWCGRHPLLQADLHGWIVADQLSPDTDVVTWNAGAIAPNEAPLVDSKSEPEPEKPKPPATRKKRRRRKVSK